MVQDVIKRSGLPKALLARDSGLSRHTFRSWVIDRTTPTPESVRQLAAGLDARAEQLHKLAEELRGAAGGAVDQRQWSDGGAQWIVRMHTDRPMVSRRAKGSSEVAPTVVRTLEFEPAGGSGAARSVRYTGLYLDVADIPDAELQDYLARAEIEAAGEAEE